MFNDKHLEKCVVPVPLILQRVLIEHKHLPWFAFCLKTDRSISLVVGFFLWLWLFSVRPITWFGLTMTSHTYFFTKQMWACLVQLFLFYIYMCTNTRWCSLATYARCMVLPSHRSQAVSDSYVFCVLEKRGQEQLHKFRGKKDRFLMFWLLMICFDDCFVGPNSRLMCSSEQSLMNNLITVSTITQYIDYLCITT